MKKETAIQKINQLKEAYFKQLPHKIHQLQKQWREISPHLTPSNLQALHRTVHSLAGTIGTYGHLTLYKGFRDLEIYLSQLIDYRHYNATHQSEIAHLIEQIKAIDQKPAQLEEHSVEIFYKILMSRLIIYLTPKSSSFSRQLKDALQQFGFSYCAIKTIENFQQKIKTHLPAAIIMDESFLDDPMLEQVSQFKKNYKIPLFCIIKQQDLPTQLRAIRAEVSSLFETGVEPHTLVSRIVELCGATSKEGCRVLILDDSEMLGEYYALILKEAGMDTRYISDPHLLMTQIQEFNPNILVFDLYLPGCTGFELATLVRQNDQYMSIPIIFVSTEDDRYKQLAILNACGGDDFLTKPVLPQNLIAAIKSRAQRAALVNAHLMHDPLTKLLNHTHILNQLQTELRRADRENNMLTIAMIDLDFFKQINDQYGHPMGDAVLKKVAHILTSRVRQTDFVGRYGGEEFMLIFPNTKLQEGLYLCHTLREQIEAHLFHKDSIQFRITVSIGLADYPHYLTAHELIAAADKFLYSAKTAGRNTIKY